MRRDIYSQIYLESIITEENIKSLIPLIQTNLFNVYQVNNYNELPDKDKVKFQQDLNNRLSEIQNKVNGITDNIQYQSWIYRILKNQDKDIDEDYDVIKDVINDFIKLCKRPDLKPEQRNIMNYPKFQDLQRFILSFQDTHNLNKDIYRNLKLLYKNNTYSCYLIQDYNECNRLFGGNDYFNTGWCVAKNKYYFDDYINKYKDKFDGYIVFIITSTNKPYALLHYGSGQFKDTSDDPLLDTSNNIIDCLYKLNPVIYAYAWDYEGDDLEKYQKQIINLYFKDKNITKDTFKKTEDNEYIINNINDIYVLNGLFDNRLPKIVLSDNIINDDITYLNKAFKNIISIEGLKLNNSITNLLNMFSDCESLKTVPLFDTSKITNMEGMFANCRSLESVPLFDTSNVINMERMFYNCGRLKTVLLFNTSNVTNMKYMFNNCSRLKTVPLFDTSNVTDMIAMFYNCGNLESVPLFDTSNVTDMYSMFSDCESLKTVPLFNTSNVTKMYQMFSGCKNLKLVPLFNTSNVTDMHKMFSDCESLKTVPLFDTSNVTDMYKMFFDCINLQSIPLFNISKANKIDSIFKACTTLENNGYPINDPIKCFELAKARQ